MMEALTRRQVVKLNSNLIQDLHVVYLEFSDMKGFPDGYCTPIGKVIEDMGFLHQEGFFKLDHPNIKGILSPTHVWCKDAEGVIIDLTTHQFNRYLKNPLLKGVQLVYPGDTLYTRYVPLNSPVV